MMVLQTELEEIEAQVAVIHAFPASLDPQAVAAARRRAQRIDEALEEIEDVGQSTQMARSTRMIRKRLKLALTRLPDK